MNNNPVNFVDPSGNVFLPLTDSQLDQQYYGNTLSGSYSWLTPNVDIEGQVVSFDPHAVDFGSGGQVGLNAGVLNSVVLSQSTINLLSVCQADTCPTTRLREMSSFDQLSLGLGFLKAVSAVNAATTTIQSSRVFWSGGRNVAGEVAQEWARKNGAITLEMTITGRMLEKFNRILPPAVRKKLWDAASKSFAEGARNGVHVFQTSEGVRRLSIWAQTEYPILKKKGLHRF